MSNRIVGVILFAFLVFVTMKGDLLGYLQVVGLAPGGEQPSGPAPIANVKSSGGGGGDILGSIAGKIFGSKVGSAVSSVDNVAKSAAKAVAMGG